MGEQRTGRVLVNVPRLNMPGGVANYYQAIKPHLSAHADYFEIGAEAHEGGLWTRIRRLIGDFLSFRRLVASGQYQLVHLNPSLLPASTLRDGLFLLIAKAYGIPVLVFFRGWDPDFALRIRRYFPGPFRIVFRRADSLIVLAEEFKQQLGDLGIHSPIYIETTVVEDSVFLPANEASPAVKTADSCYSILYLSRLVKGKGLELVIEAFAGLQEACPTWRLLIAGDGAAASSARALVNERRISNVEFLGHVGGEAKRQAYKRSHIFCFPTFYGEGMPNAVLEAMGHGLPVVTRPVGGLADFFEDGRMGHISAAGDPATFTQLLQDLAENDDKRGEMGAYNRRYAQGRFAAARVAKRLIDVYASLL